MSLMREDYKDLIKRVLDWSNEIDNNCTHLNDPNVDVAERMKTWAEDAAYVLNRTEVK